MKILHTADWHIGKKLYKHELYEDFRLFIHWIKDFIAQHKVDVLLVSGDIFDSSNPTSEARKHFYESLVLLRSLSCKIIITGGNHDAPSVLNAPSELLKVLDIHIIGCFPTDLSQCLIPIEEQGKPQLIIAAIPFLRDAELRKLSDTTSYEDRIKAIQEGIETTFRNIYLISQQKYPDTPIIAMGHLFATGDFTASDSEREIQIGNEARFDVSRLQKMFQYIALGHIHKPQKLNSDTPTYYSGSPIPLSFSERKDQKRILLLDTQNGFVPQSIEVPVFRKLLTIKGNLEQIIQKVTSLHTENTLKNLIELILEEDQFSPEIEDQFNLFVNGFESPFYEIVKTKMEFKDRIISAGQLFDTQKQLTDLKPQEVFEKLLDTQPYDTATRKELLELFEELVQEAYQQAD